MNKIPIDDRVKLAEIKLKQEQAKEIKIKLQQDLQKIENDKKKLKIDEINQLGRLLESITVDDEKTLPGGSFTFKQVFDTEETNLIKKTLVKKIKDL